MSKSTAPPPAPAPPPPALSSTPPTLRLSSRKSSKARISDILEGARERAESIDAANSANVSPRLQPLLGSSRSRRTSDPLGPAHPEHLGLGGSSRDDGGNGVVTTQPERQRTLSYQGTAEISPSARRRSAQSRKASGQLPGPALPQSDGQGGGEGEAGDRSTGQQQEEPWWKQKLGYFKSIELENKGSVARDHLALERTFLAWLRTSLAFASIGIAITQLFRLNTSLAENTEQADRLRHLGKPLGATFLAISILMLLLGYNRYLQGQYWVIRGKFPASRGTILLVSFIAFAVTLASLIVILAVQSDPD